MIDILKEHYGDVDVIVGLTNYDSFDEEHPDDGYGTCSRGDFEYEGILPRPDDFGVEYYFDVYDEVEECDLEAVILLRKKCICDSPSDIEYFNNYCNTNFKTFKECYDYAAADDIVDDKPYGLAMSATIFKV